VVGFLGYFVNCWQWGGTDRVFALPCGSDLIVHPEVRKKGLMRAMHGAAFKELERKYSHILVFSPNKDSTPGALSLGFIPLVKVERLRRYSISAILRSRGQKAAAPVPDRAVPKLGTFGSIEVTDRPLVDPMTALVQSRPGEAGKIALLKNRDFFAWRYESKRRKYLFYYYWENGELRGYMVLRAMSHPPSGVILDFEQTESAVFGRLLKFVIGHVRWSTLTIWDLGLEKEVRQRLRRRRFIRSGAVERLFKGSKADPFVLLRPSKENFEEPDFQAHGFDLRNPTNWELKEICSDIS
jgi:hypothetical protein